MISIRRLLPESIRTVFRNKIFNRRYNALYQQRLTSKSESIENSCNPKLSSNNEKHVVIIVLDGLRKKNLSLYGNKRETTPNIDSLSKSSTIFENCFSPSPWSYPSCASLMTGLYPSNNGVFFRDEVKNLVQGILPPKIKETVFTIPEILSYLGFKTSLFSSNLIAASLSEGHFEENKLYTSGGKAGKVVKSFKKWIWNNRKSNTFTYLHLNDLHEPLTVDKNYVESFGEIPPIDNLKGWSWNRGIDLSSADFINYRKAKIQLYDCGIRYLDAQMSEIFKVLEKIDNTLLFVSSDHGEEMWEHARIEKEFFYDPRGKYGVAHGHNVFNEIINLPLIVKGIEKESSRVYNNVSSCDIFPTIMSFSGVHFDNLNLDGVSLYKIEEKSNDRIIHSEACAFGFEKKAVIHKNHKFISSRRDKIDLLFDIVKDPGEKTPLFDKGKMEEMKGFIHTFGNDNIEAKPVLDKEIMKELEKLGYLS